MLYVSHKDLPEKGTTNDNSLKIVNTFSNRVYKAGVIQQARKNRFKSKDESKRKRRLRALHRNKRQKQLIKDFKKGKDDFDAYSGNRRKR